MVNKNNLWQTPCVVANNSSEDLDRGLAQIIKSKAKEICQSESTPIAGLNKGTTTHWLHYNVLNWNFPECLQLRDFILAGIRYFIETCFDNAGEDFDILGISCWANILRKGEGLQIHHHDPAFVLGNYIVQTGDDVGRTTPDAAHTIYYQPGFFDRSHEGIWDGQWRYRMAPKAGQLIVLPGYVRHEVRPHWSDAERISIAFDCYVKKQKPLINFGGPRWWKPTV